MAPRDARLRAVKNAQNELEARYNSLLRQLLATNQPQKSEAEEKWFKELTRVKIRLDSQRGLVAEVKSRMGEGKRFIELASRRVEKDEESGKKKLDGRVMEAIEETYGP